MCLFLLLLSFVLKYGADVSGSGHFLLFSTRVSLCVRKAQPQLSSPSFALGGSWRLHSSVVDAAALFLCFQGSSSSQLQSWTVQPSFEVISAQPQLFVLHPPVPSPVSPCHTGEKKSESRNYLPILNSYTKIAPHPGKRGLNSEDRGTSGVPKKVCTERLGPSLSSSEPAKTGRVLSSPSTPAPPSSKLTEDSALQGVPSLGAGGSPQTLQPVSSSHVAKAPSLTFASPASPVCASDSTLHGLESSSPLSPLSASYSSPLWAAEHLCRSPDIFSEQRQNKHRRFQNTLVVLHKSGLLEITLKTKELIRQNQATQVELERSKYPSILFVSYLR